MVMQLLYYNLYILVNISYLQLNAIRILAMLAVLAGASLFITEFGVISSAVAQSMTGGNATASNATKSGSVSNYCGPYKC
jgi:hypothetical protein